MQAEPRSRESFPPPPRSYFDLLERKYAPDDRAEAAEGAGAERPSSDAEAGSLLPWLLGAGVVLLPLLLLSLGWPWLPGAEPSRAVTRPEPPPPWVALPTLGETRPEPAELPVPRTAPEDTAAIAPAMTEPPVTEPAMTAPAVIGRDSAVAEGAAPSSSLAAMARLVAPVVSGPELPSPVPEPTAVLELPVLPSVEPEPVAEPREPEPRETRGALSAEEAQIAVSAPPAEPPDVPPSRLVTPMPVYPQEAWVYGTEGDVQLRTWIDEEGAVTAIEVVRGLPHGLTEAAVAAVSRWRFRPALRNGRPTPAEHALSIRFTL